MHLKPDNTVRVEIDEEKIYEGSLKEDWELLKPKEIPDPADKKPEDWADDSMMNDPESKKPDDWVEEKRIVDPAAKKPDDWDDEEDGDWEAPMIDNPEYKGSGVSKEFQIPHTRGSGSRRKLQIRIIKTTTICTVTQISASWVSICGRSRVAPSLITLF